MPPRTRLTPNIPLLLDACCFASTAALRICDTLLPSFASDFSVTIGQAARTIFAFAIAYGLCQLLFGPLGDRFGKLRIIALCALAGVIGNGMAFLAPTLDWLVLARVISGAFCAGIFPLAMAWIGDNVPYHARQAALARIVSAGVLGMLAGQWLSGLIAEHAGWRPAFFILAVLFFASGLLLLSALRHEAPPAAAPPAARPAFWTLLSAPAVRWMLIVVAIEGALAFGALAFMPSLLQRHHEVSLSLAGGIAAFYGIGGFLYTRMAARLLGKLGESGLAQLGGALLFLGLVSFAFLPVLILTPLACLLAGFGFYCLHNTLQTKATQMAPAARGAAMSLFACCLFMGQSVGVTGAAWVADHLTDRLIFGSAGAGLLLLGIIVGRGGPRARQPEQAP